MSLIVTGLAVAGGILLGRLVGSSLFEKKKSEGEAKQAAAPDTEETKKVEPKKEAIDLDAFPCRLGDVVLRTTGEEAWLAGAIVLHETDAPPLFVLYHSPDSGGDSAVLVEPSEEAPVIWLRPISDLGIRGEPPSAVEHEGAHFDRARRLPLHATRIGTGTPDVAKSLVFAEYTGVGDARLIVLSGDGACHAYLGQTLLVGSFDVLPSGKSTLDD